MTDVSPTGIGVKTSNTTTATTTTNNTNSMHENTAATQQKCTNNSLSNGDGLTKIPTITKEDENSTSNNNQPIAVMSTSVSSSIPSRGQSPATTPNRAGAQIMHSQSGIYINMTTKSDRISSDSVTHGQSGNNSAANTALSSPVSCASPSLHHIGGKSSMKATVSGREASQQDVEEVARLFDEKPEAFEKWLTERAPPEALSRLHEFIESRKLPKRPSVTSDLFQQWMAASPMHVSIKIT
ncbi:cGMP-specific 3',5'-cyclic phosphodiesterase-like [Teleopsis dalmanni]|uniref:cGMP-specific 3',5'-cyclic phosphodiesterase-like n=1 Tax=Teleopsis dalmanni TaxID=139649 RepID=UPI0018CD9EAE|nr:cGMP-specific 3',5'-cyclic phosphodiesterase-like [Teleopsis dalmanni]